MVREEEKCRKGGGWSISAKACDSCKSASALLFCRADSAFLCISCDSNIHTANKLASRHERVWMCEVCEQAPASFTCKADAASLCVTCDRDIHSANPLARRHERFPVVPFYESAVLAFKSGSNKSSVNFLVPDHHHHHLLVKDDFNEDEEIEAASWLLQNPNNKLIDSSETGGIIISGGGVGETPDLMKSTGDYNDFFTDIDPYLDLDFAPPVLNSKFQNHHHHQNQNQNCASDSVVPVQTEPIQVSMFHQISSETTNNCIEFDFSRSKPSYSYNTQSLSQSVSSSSLDVGVVPDGGNCNSMADISNPFVTNFNSAVVNNGNQQVTQLSSLDREARVLRFKSSMSSSLVVITIFFLLLLLCFFINPSYSDPRATEAALICTTRTASNPNRQIFISNFLSAMDAVTPQISSQRFARTVNGVGNNTVYAFGECMKDLSKVDCDQCFAQCKTQILRCLPFQLAVRGGREYYDGCYLRYDDYSFFGEDLNPQDKTICGKQDFFSGNLNVFRKNVIELVRNLTVEALKNDGFSVGFVDKENTTVYGLAQCWKFVNSSSCQRCLENATTSISSCPPKEEGRVTNAGCYLRYSPTKFYDNSTGVASASRGGRRRLPIIMAVVSSIIAVLMIVAAVTFFGKRKIAERRKERKQLGALAATINRSELNFKYETLERATNYFNTSNKLGQGGSGSVFKATLPDGKIVAVKRLFFNTRQWVDQFFNEVNLIADVNHKNLVKLLGCSITGPESLLVYEYVANKSLQEHLFDRNYGRILSWDERYNIIVGTAEGLTYLHEESNLRIIHRDIKLSNILLDDNFVAKIADFGLARLFPADKTHVSTVVAGTLGYMAPEYVIFGKLTEKADVYSFGVLVIEVVSGRRCNSFSEDSFSILQMVWDHFGSGQLSEDVDPNLEGRFRREDASRLLQIGLLCTQASADLRPPMSIVVKMLTDNYEIPQPTQPPYLNTLSRSFNPPDKTSKSPANSYTGSSGNDTTQSLVEAR